ncbi:MAG: DUF5763 domain-containing protein [Syntrophothermus sp.]
MNTYVKTLKSALGHKYISLPLYALAGTSAFFLFKHLVSKKENNGEEHDKTENFRAASTQFDNRQLGIIEQMPQEDIKVPPSELNGAVEEVAAAEVENPEQCRAITLKGTRCRKKAVEDGYCYIHKPGQ